MHAIVAYIHLHGDADGAFFQQPDSMPISKQWFIKRMQGIVTELGLPLDHHSFQIGAATTAALAGVKRLHDTGTRPVAQCGILAVYPSATRSTGSNLVQTGLIKVAATATGAPLPVF